jgi:dihydroxyacetone kinase
MSSLDGPGFSITLLKATAEMVEYIDAPTTALGWAPPRKVTLGAEVKDEPPVTGTGHAVATATGPVLQREYLPFLFHISQVVEY